MGGTKPVVELEDISTLTGYRPGILITVSIRNIISLTRSILARDWQVQVIVPGRHAEVSLYESRPASRDGWWINLEYRPGHSWYKYCKGKLTFSISGSPVVSTISPDWVRVMFWVTWAETLWSTPTVIATCLYCADCRKQYPNLQRYTFYSL